MNTQNDAILAYLQAGGTLTPLDALERFGCFRLGARVWDLKERGYNIVSERLTVPGGKVVAKYSLRP